MKRILIGLFHFKGGGHQQGGMVLPHPFHYRWWMREALS